MSSKESVLHTATVRFRGFHYTVELRLCTTDSDLGDSLRPTAAVPVPPNTETPRSTENPPDPTNPDSQNPAPRRGSRPSTGGSSSRKAGKDD